MPDVLPLTVGQSGVEQGDPFPETLAKTLHELRCEADFWHQHQGLAPLGEHRLNEVEIDLGFTATGHAVEQAWVKVVQLGADAVDRLLLSRVQPMSLGAG
jgi:hypothetical protein